MRISAQAAGLFALLALLSGSSADVVINEIVAAASEYRVGTDLLTGERRIGSTRSWKEPGFDDASWESGTGRFSTGGAGTGTLLPGSIGSSAFAVYFRTEFTVPAGGLENAGTLVLDINYEDGFIAYVNGREVARRNMGAVGAFAYHDQQAFNDIGPPGLRTIQLGMTDQWLVEGENTVAIQVHDFGESTLLMESVVRSSGGPVWVPSDGTWRYFVGTREPSGGLHDDGEAPPDSGLALEWTKAGFDRSGWASGFSPIGYDTESDYAFGTRLQHAQVQGIAPSLYVRFPFSVTAAEIGGIDGLDAVVDYDDGFVLYLNGIEIARRNLGAPGSFASHTATATASHGAREEGGGDNPNAVETFAVDPSLLREGENMLAVQVHNVTANSSDLVISSALVATGAAGRTLVADRAPCWYLVGLREPSEVVTGGPPPRPKFSDWIELHNNGPEAVDLGGWSLSDRANGEGWVFPPTVIDPEGFLVVLASGKNITAPSADGFMHTDFRLNASGEPLRLLDPSGSVVSSLGTEYPPQSFFHSYGRSAGGGLVYFHAATPGMPNSGPEFAQIVSAPEIDKETGFYVARPQVRLTAPDAGAVIRYTTDGSTPTETNGEVYSGGILGSADNFDEGPVGTILRESWYGASGATVADIPSDLPPDLVVNTFSTNVPPDFTDNYATRLHGWLHPPHTGDYVFWIACDEDGEIRLSTDDLPANAARIAHTPEKTPPGVYDLHPEQQSAPIRLVAGEKYYVSILQKEATGNDNLSVQWQGPGVSRGVITGTYLSPVIPAPVGQRTEVVKARAFLPGAIPSEVVTRTYAIGFPSGIRHGPAIFLSGDSERTFFAPDGVTSIVGGRYNDSNRWEPSDPVQTYNFAMVEGRPFEREATFEMVMPDGTLAERTGFGLRIAGSPHARPHYRPLDPADDWLGGWTTKPSLNFFFRDDFGVESLDVPLIPGQAPGGFQSLRLRAGKNDSSNPFVKDEIMRRLSRATGQAASRGAFVNMWINGSYKAYFNLVERLREPFFQRHYQSDNDWDIWHIREMVEGDRAHYDATMHLLRNSPMNGNANYAEAESRVDMANYIDYILVNVYGATGDWPHNNYNLARERAEGGKWTFNVWDAEGAFGGFGNSVSANTFTAALGGSPAGDGHMSRIVYKACKVNPEFRLLFADRIQKHFFNDGGLTQDAIKAVFDETYAEFSPIHAAVRGHAPSRSFFDNWWPTRRDVLFGHFASENLWPSTAPPAFSRHGGEVPAGFALDMSGAPAGGTIYFTTDGSDPRARGGAIVGQAYASPLPILRTTVVKARARAASGEWSALTEAVFVSPEPPALAITEIHFNPDGDDATEFLELRNVGDTEIDLAGIHFTAGLTFAFGGGMLAPGDRLVLVRDAVAFAVAYPGVPIAGEFEAGALDNGGERLVVAEPGGRVIVEARYGDSLDAADGGGYSLVLVPGGDPSLRESWVSEYVLGGSPGGESVITFAGWAASVGIAADPLADGDLDGLTDLLEYVFGTDPAVATPTPWAMRAEGNDRALATSWRIAGSDIQLAIETSEDGVAWTDLADARTASVPVGGGMADLHSLLPAQSETVLVRMRCVYAPW